MFKCKTCGRVYEGEECFSLSSDATATDDCRVFDGKEMRDQCPACGGLLYPCREKQISLPRKAAA